MGYPTYQLTFPAHAPVEAWVFDCVWLEGWGSFVTSDYYGMASLGVDVRGVQTDPF